MSESADPRARWRELPPPVRLEDTVESRDPDPVPPFGPAQDPNRQAALRFVPGL